MADRAIKAPTWWSEFQRAALRKKFVRPEPQGNQSRNAQAQGPSLVRRLSLWDLILIGLGASIGAGIFVLTGVVAQEAGPGVVLSFTISGVASIFNALCFAELACRFPAMVGGAYLYTYFTFNELTAFIVVVQLLLDYHIGAASILRSLASYIATVLRLIPAVDTFLPTIFGPGGLELFGGWLSINLLAPILLIIITVVLSRGVHESAVVNDIMTVTKVVIVVLVIVAGAFEVDVTNWSPFAPSGFFGIIQGATVTFFAYIGFDAVVNTAEESSEPQRDLPIAVISSVSLCTIFYVGVCLVVTGMVPYYSLDASAPLASAFVEKGLKFFTILISIGAIAGLTTTVLVGLYVQSRLYLGVGRDGLFPSIFSKVSAEHRTPVVAQIWIGLVVGVLCTFVDVSHLSHILSVGALVAYSVVCACVVVLRTRPEEHWHLNTGEENAKDSKKLNQAIGFTFITGLLGFAMGLSYRLSAHPAYFIFFLLLEVLCAAPMFTQQRYYDTVGFSCPAVPALPLVAILMNMFMFAQLHWEAWVRFVVLTVLAVIVYGVYGRYNSTIETVPDREAAQSLLTTSDVDRGTDSIT